MLTIVLVIIAMLLVYNIIAHTILRKQMRAHERQMIAFVEYMRKIDERSSGGQSSAE